MRAASRRGVSERGAAVNIELVLYALVATASPLVLGVTLAVLASGRSKSLLFALGFVLAQALVCALVVFLGTSIGHGDEPDHPRLRGLLEASFGVALVVLAGRVRLGADDAAVSQARAQRLFERVRRVRPTTAFMAGLLLGIGGPKRLPLTVLAGTSIAVSGVSDSQALALVAAYTAVATLLVWLPVLAFAVAGDRVLGTLHAAEAALERHQRPLAFYSLLLVGALALVDGLIRVL
jgi:hypothetical protein